MNKDAILAFIKKSPVVVICVVLTLGLAAGIYFRLDEIPDAAKLLEDKNAEADRYAANIKNSAHLKEDLDTLIAANKAIDARLVRAVQLLDNAQYFDELEKETGVKLMNRTQTTPSVVAKPAKGSFVPIAFSVAADGTLPQLVDFLRKVEGGAHYSRVLTAACSVNVSKRNSTLTLSCSVELLGIP